MKLKKEEHRFSFHLYSFIFYIYIFIFIFINRYDLAKFGWQGRQSLCPPRVAMSLGGPPKVAVSLEATLH